jgi:hypothetical protein
LPADGAPIPGGVVIALSLAMFLFARIIDVNFLQALSFIGVAYGLVIFWGGWQLSNLFLFPLAFLMLMIPSVSYLIESIAGAILRWAVLHGSYIVLKITSGSWQLHPAGLQYGQEFLTVGFSRGGFSSILFLLIVHFAVCEGVLKNEMQKFFFMVHFPLYFVAAFILFFILSGWAMVLGAGVLNAVFQSGSGWIPLLCFLLFLVGILLYAGRLNRKKGHLKRR